MANQIDWGDLKTRIDVVAEVTRILGPPPGRRGQNGGRPWWSCPFHQDRNPSFTASERGCHCFGCGWNGDIVAFVMKITSLGFRDAITKLAEGVAFVPVAFDKTPSQRRELTPSVEMMGNADALEFVRQAVETLWSPVGAPALEYLRKRGLKDETIRRHRLGWATTTPKMKWVDPGLTIPWLRDDDLVLVKLRPESGRPRRYLEVYRHPMASDRDDPPVFPGLGVIESSEPLVITEGEFDCMLVAQELEGLANAITLGGASFKPGPTTLSASTPAWPRFAAQDADDAGDKAAARWPSSFNRIRPPGSFHRNATGELVNDKDWGDAHANGINLRRWWSHILDGVERPALYSWDELAAMRGGGGIVIDRKVPRDELEATIRASQAAGDPYDTEERLAIQQESLSR